MEDTSAALRAAEELVEALKSHPRASHAEHLALLERVDSVRALLETPYDVIERQQEVMSTAGAMYTLIMTGAIKKVPDEGTITAKELAAETNMDVSAIQRLMRVSVVAGFFTETAPDTYAHSALSRAYQLDAQGPFFVLIMEFNKMYMTLPDYFKTHRPEDLYDLRKSPFCFSVGKEGKTYYEAIDEIPEHRGIWDQCLQIIEKNMPISGMFPWESLKENVEKEPERPFFVDVAGGRGQALLKLQEEIPGVYGGKLILQDLPIVIDSLKPEEIPNIEAIAYDIFTPQPIKNAHVYFMRRLLHDFYPSVCIDILKNTVSAMGPDSRLIVCDMLVPEKVEPGRLKELYWLDLNLMAITGKEKTLDEFKQMFDAVGLELVKVWPSAIGATVQLETRLKRS
ncbi:S-adenosyl-L-methionine-dependent methyltransferase [Parathielavia appendiculata]|uniref:S-adenosyl-L-methionine-dependent methyltransferase n=1 Tax=Parathielavia appendiculata TaxID=2587402 RepID=A0AAN6Z110_9PEZI|nr:S-adenosyl-L-methionine-dependent methyltransferase [Parathielavia appendiculata]